MTTNGTTLFASSSVCIDGVLSQVYGILRGHLMPLLIIAVVKTISIAVTTSFLSLFTFLIARTAIMHIVRSIINGGMGPMPDGTDLDTDDAWPSPFQTLTSSYENYYSTVAENGTRLLLLASDTSSNKPYVLIGERDDGWTGDNFPDPFVPHEDIKPDHGDDHGSASGFGVIVGIFLLLIIWITVLSLVLSTFAGAMHHTIAQIYASTESGVIGSTASPSPIKAIKRGYAKKGHIFSYMLLLSSIFVLLTFITIGIPSAYLGVLGKMFFSMLYFIATFVICICTIAAIPTIVVEGKKYKSPLDALRRSMSLCRRYMCFIFCTQLVYRIVMGLGFLLVAFVLGQFGSIGQLVLFVGLPLFLAVMDPVLSFVMYMSMRIQSEHVRQDEFARELADADNDDDETSPLDGNYTLLLDAEVVSDHDHNHNHTVANPFGDGAGADFDPEVEASEETEVARAEVVSILSATEVEHPSEEAGHDDEGAGDVEQNA